MQSSWGLSLSGFSTFRSDGSISRASVQRRARSASPSGLRRSHAPTSPGDDTLVRFKARKYQPWHTCIQWRYASFDEAMAWFAAVVKWLQGGGKPGIEMPGWRYPDHPVSGA